MLQNIEGTAYLDRIRDTNTIQIHLKKERHMEKQQEGVTALKQTLSAAV